jgi:hypothetical protein
VVDFLRDPAERAAASQPREKRAFYDYPRYLGLYGMGGYLGMPLPGYGIPLRRLLAAARPVRLPWHTAGMSRYC